MLLAIRSPAVSPTARIMPPLPIPAWARRCGRTATEGPAMETIRPRRLWWVTGAFMLRATPLERLLLKISPRLHIQFPAQRYGRIAMAKSAAAAARQELLLWTGLAMFM